MPVPSVLYDRDGEKIWNLNESKKSFQRQSVWMVERDLFLSTMGDLNKFKKLMNEHPFVCTQPLQIRVMGELDEVREVSKKILRTLGVEKDNTLKIGRTKAFDKDGNETMTYKSGTIGLSKLECDKKNRVGNFCSTTIRAYINPPSDKKTTCKPS